MDILSNLLYFIPSQKLIYIYYELVDTYVWFSFMKLHLQKQYWEGIQFTKNSYALWLSHII